MAKIKVNINKPDPPSKRIQKYKNYNNFVDTYKKLHTPKGIWEMWYYDRNRLAMIVVMLMLLLIFILSDWENEGKNKKDQTPKKKVESVK